MSAEEGLTAPERDKVKQLLLTCGASMQCAACGTGLVIEAEGADLLWTPQPDRSLREQGAIRSYPAVVVSCPKCACLRLHDAEDLGLVQF